ncbi:uncharacterized protein si:ch211-171b20.3 [Phycodurus eques]|uniref:uncharacterized protein si:ch211-171b20.3 n=1 Tax=Phycodurus eques TaxID=693459 RepID=UPI002ACDC6AF|nr:uncharacterized protein si:ch211-171b20.3 [Phycodurus eques]
MRPSWARLERHSDSDLRLIRDRSRFERPTLQRTDTHVLIVDTTFECYSAIYKPNLCPAVLFPSTLVLSGLSTFPVQNCKYNRARGNYVAYTLLTFRGNLKSQSYPDPLMGASCSFLHRISELSWLEGETATQEKLKKMRISRKASSS